MKKSILFLFMFAIMAMQTMAQVPQPRPDGGKLNSKVKTQAAINKILDSTVSKVELLMSKIPYQVGTTISLFKDRRINLKENNKGAFALKEKITVDPVRTFPNGKAKPYTESYSFKPTTTSTYKNLLNNGFTVNIDFTERYNQFTYKCDFTLVFYFSDGTRESVLLQEINVSTEGSYTYPNDVHLTMNLPGSVFPDPAKPLPQVK